VRSAAEQFSGFSPVVKENFEDGRYKNDVEAEADFRQLVDSDFK
jgi:hypothetical protein